MNTINDSIIYFLERQTSATICCTDETGNPYCFSCYYVFNQENALLYFKSSAHAHHVGLLADNRVIAGTILPDKLNKLITKGIQLLGVVVPPFHHLSNESFLIYHKKHPMALVIAGEVFTIRLDCVKMTDSKLGFGKKICWKRVEKILNATIR